MIITVDCNSDTLAIESENDNPNVGWKILEPNKVLKILDEIFTSLDHDVVGVQLIQINEDKRHTIGEW